MGCAGSYIAAFVLGIEHVGYKVTIEIGIFSFFQFILSFFVTSDNRAGHVPTFFLDLERILDNMNGFLILKILFKNFCSVSFPYKSLQHFKEIDLCIYFFPNDGIVLDCSVCSCERTHFFHIKINSLLKSIIYSENNNFF